MSVGRTCLRNFYVYLAGVLPKDLVYCCTIRLMLAAADRNEMPADMRERIALLVGKWTTHYDSLYPIDKCAKEKN